MAMYAAVPTDTPYPTVGARMNLEQVTDEALLGELRESAPQDSSPLYFEIVSVRSLG